MCTNGRIVERLTACLLTTALMSFLVGCSLSSAGTGGSGGSGGGGGTGAHSVSLTWKASTSSNVVGYNIYRGSSTGSYGLLNSMNSTTSYSDTTVQNGQSYFYVVTAVDSAGAESPYSNAAEATIP
jgi:hypothetical protein